MVTAHDANAEGPRQRYEDRAAVSGGSGAMFDRIARRYDLLNRIMSLGLDQSWRKKLVKALDVDVAAKVLDVATGTADVALAVADAYPRARVMGIDPSVQMLDIGRDKVDARGLENRVELREADAQALPFEDNAFDAAVISFGIRNVPDRQKGIEEMARVTRPHGKVVVLELNEPQGGIMAALARFHVHEVVPRVGALLSGAHEYRYLQDSIEAFPQPEDFKEMMERAGLTHVRLKKLSFGAAYLFIGEVVEA
ncbi:MAG: bifunctional demethylmenaquinone methyltransferase/2-methoxy-6-polyprenyl-1,4-benzoquinol methylase UbiE [Myxococcota bacterium]